MTVEPPWLDGWWLRYRAPGRDVMILRNLFDDDVALAQTDPREVDPALLLARERAHVETAVLRRQREFAAGRVLARRLLVDQGVGAHTALEVGPDRVPLWPAGFVGSISHCSDLACAVVAPATVYRSLGCDVEHSAALSEGVARRVVCTAAERARLGEGPEGLRRAKIVFSAKEAFYKLQYPLTRTRLGFADAEVSLDVPTGELEVSLLRAAGPFAVGARFTGRFLVTESHVATGLALRA